MPFVSNVGVPALIPAPSYIRLPYKGRRSLGRTPALPIIFMPLPRWHPLFLYTSFLTSQFPRVLARIFCIAQKSCYTCASGLAALNIPFSACPCCNVLLHDRKNHSIFYLLAASLFCHIPYSLLVSFCKYMNNPYSTFNKLSTVTCIQLPVFRTSTCFL